MGVMEVFSEGWNELIRLYHQLNRSLTWREVVVYTSIPLITWWTYKILIRPFLSPLRKIPGRPYIPIVGNMFQALKKEAMSNTLDWMLEANSKFIRFYYLYGEERLLVADPEIVRYITVTNWQNYHHMKETTISRLFPNFILSLRGEDHKYLRKLLNPTFGRVIVESFCGTFEKLTNIMIENWDNQIGNQESCVIEAQNFLTRMTLDAICECGFDYNMNSISNPDESGVQSFRRILLDFRVRLIQMIPLLNLLPFTVNVQRRTDMKHFKDTIKAVLNKKKEMLKTNSSPAANKYSSDLLTLLLKARDETDKGLDDCVILENIGGFLFAGFETTSSSLTWILLNLSEYPDVQDKVREEINEVLPSSDKPITGSDVEKLTYLTCVINETLRLYPVGPCIFRETVKEDVINGYTIPAGTPVGISISGLHRHPDNWKDPEKFIPERFLEEYDHNKFMPFAVGPLMCIGKRFAMMEMQVVLTCLLRKYKFHKAPGYKYRRILNLTLVPDPPLILRVEKV